MLTAVITDAINAHAAQCYPRECCGVIVDDKYIACNNIAADAAQFEICPRDLVRAQAQGAIRAYVHSHPDGSTTPSTPDRVQMALHGLPWVITDGINIELHHPDDYQAPLLGRPYYHGLLDCYAIARDYYARELGIVLNDYPRMDKWWESKSSPALYLDHFAAEGFAPVDTVQKHDVILCRLGRTEHVNHALIFIGDGTLSSEQTPQVIGNDLVLHHPYGRDSLREMYSEAWQRRATITVRHKSLF